MRTITLSALFALLAGCTGAELAFSASARQELVDTFEASVDVQQALAEYTFAASRGDLDLAGAVYTPPVGSMPGTLTIPGGTFPFGTGDLTIVFTAQGDGAYVDPYVTDLTTATNVMVVADVVFTGTSNIGQAIAASADFTATTVNNGLNDVQATVNGVFDVDHGAYDFDFTATDVQMDLDLANDVVTNVLGNVNGTIDIPDFPYDADFTVDGLGATLDIDIDAVVTTISYTLGLAELQAG
ncbi:MAG TPA: hypothetical protein VI997_05245 [Candidatus Thermoplasmatota archaeon]|nr:hypothetical protein [Candidatus Thermoplasmatota archaeon]